MILEFVKTNIELEKSDMLYVCGHPGTGKTSILKIVFSRLKELFPDMEFFSFNGMAYQSLASFCQEFNLEIQAKFGDISKKKYADQKKYSEKLNLEEGIETMKALLKRRSDVPKIILIDEIDNLS